MSEIIFHTTKLLYRTFQKNDDFLGEFRVDNNYIFNKYIILFYYAIYTIRLFFYCNSVIM